MGDIAIDPWLRDFNRILQDNDGFYRGAAKGLGVPECTLWILYTLRVEEPPVTQSRICQIMAPPKQTINSALKSMAAEGYIVLRPGSDRRTREVVLTEKGRELAKRTADKVIEAEERALSSMTLEEKEGLLMGFRKITDLLLSELESNKESEGGKQAGN